MVRIAKAKLIRIVVMFAVLLMSGTGLAQTKGPLPPSKADKCPVCGMFIYKYPDWTAQIIFKDGSGVFFDGAKDMFKYYLDRGKYEPGGTPQKGIAAVYVLEYYGMKTIDAADAYFVVGSEVYGPMGHELIPFATIKDAETFQNDHRGKGILKFREITRKVIDNLD